MAIRENIARVEDRIEAACRRAGRKRAEVRLVAVTKTVPPERIREAFEAGLRDFGENRVQEAATKRAALSDLTATWHLIGHLQSNKSRRARELFHWIHSVDSLHLAQKLAACAPCPGDKLQALLEVNLGGETSKTGVREDELRALAEGVAQLETIKLRGLMAIPPQSDDPERSRPYFRRLRELVGNISAANLAGVAMTELSMGMSNDFEVAIEEGATIVRVGTAIFGPR
jgi:PLP dependent protein